MIRTAALAGVAVFLLSSCRTLSGLLRVGSHSPAGGRTLPQPSSLDHGLLIARATVRGALLPRFVSEADAGTTHTLDASGASLGMSAVSGLAAGGYIVFFDLPRGRYVLRTASFPSRGVRYRLVAAEEDAAKRAALLRPGTAAFLGVYDYDARWPQLGVAVARLGRIVGHWLTPWRRRPLLPRDADLRVFESGPQAEIAALHAVRTALSGTQWRRVIDARLRELSAVEPAKVSGTLLPRELPLREESILAWRDTLKWGSPRRVPGGLAWRRPGGSALVAVFFTSASASGFRGWEAATAELRRAAVASVEDSGEIYEVRVATRFGPTARVTSYLYPEGSLAGSVTTVLRTETTLIADGSGLFTARLRAPRGEFESVLPAYREFLLQLVLGPSKSKFASKSEIVMPVLIGP